MVCGRRVYVNHTQEMPEESSFDEDKLFERESLVAHDDRWGNAHQADERIPCDCLGTAVEFYRKFLLRYQQI